MAKERLDKILASQGTLSREGARRLIREGRVFVNGMAVRSQAEKIDPETDRVAVDGKDFSYRRFVYIMMNKPAGVISASDGKACETAVDLLPPEMKNRGVFPAGRLDRDTTGFLLLTDDGSFAHDILSPGKHVDKTYRAVLAHPLTPDEKSLAENGLTLDGKRLLPARITPTGDGNAVEIVLQEGKYHQVKRMFAAAGNPVTELTRIKIGPVELDRALAEAGWRFLTDEELTEIKKRPSESR